MATTFDGYTLEKASSTDLSEMQEALESRAYAGIDGESVLLMGKRGIEFKMRGLYEESNMAGVIARIQALIGYQATVGDLVHDGQTISNVLFIQARFPQIINYNLFYEIRFKQIG